jgi:hypothetical protein
LNPQVDLTGSAATAGIEQYRHAGPLRSNEGG